MTTPTGLFSILPHHPAVHALDARSRVVLSALYWHRNRTTGQCNPRHATLAQELGFSLSAIQRSIRKIREAGIIRTTKTQRGNWYEIRPQEEWRVVKRQRKSGVPFAACEESQVKRQSCFILNELETSLLNQTPPPPLNSGAYVGGGGSPAALPERRKPAPPAGSPSEPPLPDCEEKAKALVRELLPQHPQAGNPAGAVKAVARVLAEGGTTEAIRQSHQKYRVLWATYQPGRFVPMLAKWIQDGDWLYPPNVTTPEEAKAKDGIRKREHLEGMRKFHFLPPQIERDMTRAGFSTQEIEDELVYEGWRRRAS